MIAQDLDGRLPAGFTEVVASSVHDIKNSIGLLLSAAEAIEAALSQDSAGRGQALALQHQARRINFDLMNLLGLFKLDRAHRAVTPQVVDCAEVLEELAAYNEALLAGRGIVLTTDCSHAAEGFFDRELVLGILNSTVNNTYTYARAQVALACEVQEGYTVFSVSDDGPGYGPKILKGGANAIGQSEYRLGNTGLGLYFARRIAELHQHRGRRGRVVLGNQGINGGGCFQLWLP